MSAEKVKKEVTKEQKSKPEQAIEEVSREPVDAPADKSESGNAEQEDSKDEADEAQSKEPKSAQSEEDEKRAGVKESATNSDIVAMEKEKAEEDGDAAEGEDAAPSFFVDEKKKHRVDVDILSNKRTGQVVSVSRTA